MASQPDERGEYLTFAASRFVREAVRAEKEVHDSVSAADAHLTQLLLNGSPGAGTIARLAGELDDARSKLEELHGYVAEATEAARAIGEPGVPFDQARTYAIQVARAANSASSVAKALKQRARGPTARR